MHRTSHPLHLLAVWSIASGFVYASGQAVPASARRITPSVFAGLTGVDTGLNSGRNLSITAGLDLAFRLNRVLQAAAEYRGTYAVDKGNVDSLKNNLGGLKLATSAGRFRPYANLLAGRGEITYEYPGYQVPNKPIFYTQSSSNVFSAGGGVDVFATRSVALKVDLQVQRYASPVTPSGHLYSATGTVGFVYVFHGVRSLF